MEVEKKFVVNLPCTLEEFKKLPDIYCHRPIYDAYLGSLRFRILEDAVLITQKNGSGIVREEEEVSVAFDLLDNSKDLIAFFSRISDAKPKGGKMRYYFYAQDFEKLPDSALTLVDITFDDYAISGESLVLIMEIEALFDEKPLEEQIADIDKAFIELQALLPVGTTFQDVTGIKEYSNRSLIADASILKNAALTSSNESS